ncbi:hypothetical protein NCCP2495_04420 [Dietzia sp. NCCP-2495]|uniref:DUF3152 domain-containing protein n=1 Tax=Dietzia sp. NCCP-2495 TaxID=2934675 RepID=UPI00222EB1D1|nr:DUF3152 domain-containing protein [Dietzia sp. NCCP-2495]GLB62564.1 hypothetical protein NCCP2495_04420 [Dietzia sp. NCCP-2495]
MSDGRRPGSGGGITDPGVRRADRAPYYPSRGEPLRAPWDPEESAPGRRRSVPGARDHLRRQSPLGRFMTTWGWRAYAIPVLIVITALVIADAVRSGGEQAESTQVAGEETSEIIGAPVPGEVPPSGELPEGGQFVEGGTGEFRIVPGGTDTVGRETAELFSYTVEVEEGIDTVEFGGDDSVARMVDATLANPKSWTTGGEVAMRRIDDGEPSFRVSLASPMTVRANCGYDIELESSCYNSSTGRVYLNLARWVRGARSFQGDIGSYRQYLVNHEVGHAIGFPAHEACPADGALAPIMMQQTFGVNNSDIFRLDPEGVVPDDDKTCRFNAWPFPDGSPAQSTSPEEGRAG